jgi:hypothetical protein
MAGRAAAPLRGDANSFVSELTQIVSTLTFEEPFFNSDTGDELIECLVEWFFCDLSPEENQVEAKALLTRRLDGLKWLAEELAVAGDNLTARFDSLRRWLGENLPADGARLETALRKLDELQREKGAVPG